MEKPQGNPCGFYFASTKDQGRLNFYFLHSYFTAHLRDERFLFYLTWYLILTALTKGLLLKLVGYHPRFCEALGVGIVSQAVHTGLFCWYSISDIPKPFHFEVAFTLWLLFTIASDIPLLFIFRKDRSALGPVILGSLAGNVASSAILLMALMGATTIF
ncbi:MAG: hypothetical protein N2110_08770 [Flavobacteriales bacterium]|nr:hypothetical protein [Flavobacteriales bacterium]MCX7769096.1 hypothetical protein [Flavobacteriales bacterium]MDW8410446.1 hypothetical protein [Flavobacteriales bacterium]